MSMIDKSICLTEGQASWLKSVVDRGDFEDESQVVRELIRERQLRENESNKQLAAIRQALDDGENSGLIDQSVEQIWQTARHGKTDGEETVPTQ